MVCIVLPVFLPPVSLPRKKHRQISLSLYLSLSLSIYIYIHKHTHTLFSFGPSSGQVLNPRDNNPQNKGDPQKRALEHSW